MRYLVRSIKYFFYLMIVLSLIIAVLVFAGFVEADIETMFTHGYVSLWQIALMMAVFALIYPRFGFSKRCAHVYGEQAEQKARLFEIMQRMGYAVEKDEEGCASFIKKGFLSRLLKMYEDRISCSFGVNGIEIEGLTRDVVRLVSHLESLPEA